MIPDPRTLAFEDCLQQLQAGASLDQALKRYPRWANELRPLLSAALAAQELGRSISVPAAAQERSRAHFTAQARQYSRTSGGWPGLNFTPLRLAALILILVIIFGGVSTVVVSAQALPGDSLYTVKLIAEQTRLFFTKDPTSRLKLEQSFDQERRNEVQSLIQQSRSTPVKFSGGLRSMNPDEWLVDNVRVEITPETRVEGNIQVNFYVEVQGILQPDGRVTASVVRDREYTIVGVVRELTAQRWIVAGIAISVTPQTVIHGTVLLGSTVTVNAALNLDGDLQAHTVTVTGPPPALTDIPSPTPTIDEGNRPEPTTIPAIKETDDSGGEKEPSQTPKPTEGDDDGHETPKPSRTPRPTVTPDPTKTPGSKDDDDHHTKTPTPPQSSGTVTPTPTRMTPTPEPSVEEKTKTPRPTRTPQPTSSVSPTVKPTDD